MLWRRAERYLDPACRNGALDLARPATVDVLIVFDGYDEGNKVYSSKPRHVFIVALATVIVAASVGTLMTTVTHADTADAYIDPLAEAADTPT